ncbi:MAG: PHP domain-containing protein [Thermoplasmata archaeon]|nr:PHP domain-containing protein [Thermoplasmata archaeon]
MNASAGFDLHVHSRHSPDSREPVEALVDRAASMGLAGLALTDHNSIAGHAELAELAPRFPSLLLIPGVEVSTREGHLLLYGIETMPPVRAPISDTLLWAAAHGAVAVPAHPFRWSHGIGGGVGAQVPVSAIEVRNGHNGIRANRAAEALRSLRGLGGTGGSDAHRSAEVGRCTTVFSRPISHVADVVLELREGRSRGVGSELGATARFGLALATLGRRAARGFRPI